MPINDYVAYWPMNENSGNLVYDKTGNNSGLCTGTAVDDGKFINGRKFIGSDEEIDIGSHSSILISVFTYAAWIKPTGSTIRSIIGCRGVGTSSNLTPQLRIKTTGELELLNQDVASIGSSTGAVTNDSWNHIAVSYDASGNYVFYMNGSSSGSGTNLQVFNYTSRKMLLGARGDGITGGDPPIEEFNGTMDEVRIYNRVLSAQEVSDLYNWSPIQMPSINKIRPRPFAPGLAR